MLAACLDACRRVGVANQVHSSSCLEGQVAGLCLGIEIDCGEALFARPQAGSLRSAEWNVVVDARGRKIDHNHPGLGAGHEIMRVAQGRSDNSRRRAELKVIDESERFRSDEQPSETQSLMRT